jgi:hypothetical protein
VTTKFTKQGVRDLNDIKAPAAGRKLEMSPRHQLCDHRDAHGQSTVREIDGYYSYCLQCGVNWDIKW